MLKDFYDLWHGMTLFGHEIHFYDIPVLILLVIFVVMIITHVYKFKKREKEFNEEQEIRLEEQSKRNDTGTAV